ncbi:MAG: glucokinase [Acidobacteria bacterium]|nr:glucokinase [Acidobacteriota bacterium]MBV9624492.1 glucokinase [Acidobacteriota bacterium]
MILAGDIGGTHARLALFNVDKGKFQLVRSAVFPSQHYAGLERIIAEFVGNAGIRPAQACFGIAGPVTNGRVVASNLPWIVESALLAEELKISQAGLINDLEATGWGIGALSASDLVPLNDRARGSDPTAQGNQAVIAAGTGLGEGGLYWDGKRHYVFASEGGHCDFAPVDDIQIELFQYLRTRYGRVSYERIVSGPGLVNVFEFLRDTGRAEVPDSLAEEIAKSDPAAAVSTAALVGKTPIAEQALDIFVMVFGAEAGNLALKLKATGGVFLAGGIAPKILPKLHSSLFLEAFLAKGRLRPLMEIMPVQVITNDQLALLGAARCAMVELPSS